MTDNIPTLPRPAPMPREEAPTPIPRRSSLEELRASDDPYITALDELRAEVLRLSGRLPELDARTSRTDLEQEAKLADHETRMQRIEASSKVKKEKPVFFFPSAASPLEEAMLQNLRDSNDGFVSQVVGVSGWTHNFNGQEPIT